MSNDAISIINRGTVVMYYTKNLSKNIVFIYTVNTVYIVYSEKNHYFFF